MEGKSIEELLVETGERDRCRHGAWEA